MNFVIKMESTKGISTPEEFSEIEDKINDAIKEKDYGSSIVSFWFPVRLFSSWFTDAYHFFPKKEEYRPRRKQVVISFNYDFETLQNSNHEELVRIAVHKLLEAIKKNPHLGVKTSILRLYTMM